MHALGSHSSTPQKQIPPLQLDPRGGHVLRLASRFLTRDGVLKLFVKFRLLKFRLGYTSRQISLTYFELYADFQKVHADNNKSNWSFSLSSFELNSGNEG